MQMAKGQVWVEK